VIDELNRAGVTVSELPGVEPNPRIQSVRKGIEICRAKGIEGVLAVGGGSTIDCAKVIAAGACYEGDAWELVLDARKITKALPVASVLTLAATGSEMDGFAVISDMEKNEKWGTGILRNRYFQFWILNTHSAFQNTRPPAVLQTS
jgi:alcohol dehydrogenase YqhD (iron-dependent ADH family)